VSGLPVGGLVERDSVRDAARTLDGIAVRTPLLAAPWIGAGVRLKCENLQRAGAFKLRGAYTMIARLTDEERARGVIAYSSGNHAQGVALAARLFGLRAVVVMPTTAPAIKVEGARRLGAEVVIEGTTSIERQKRAEAIAAEDGYTIIPAFDHPDIIAGQGTVGLEIMDEWHEVDTIVVPIGGGGLVSGVAACVRAGGERGIRVIGVEPENADAMHRSLDRGEPVTIEPKRTIADGLAPVRPGDLTFRHVRDLVDEVVLVYDDQIAEATFRLMAEAKLIVEFSGAATVAALLSGRVDLDGHRTVAVLSGGNIDPRRALAAWDAAARPEMTPQPA
jgi:threonine dehydratase